MTKWDEFDEEEMLERQILKLDEQPRRPTIHSNSPKIIAMATHHHDSPRSKSPQTNCSFNSTVLNVSPTFEFDNGADYENGRLIFFTFDPKQLITCLHF